VFFGLIQQAYIKYSLLKNFPIESKFRWITGNCCFSNSFNSVNMDNFCSIIFLYDVNLIYYLIYLLVPSYNFQVIHNIRQSNSLMHMVFTDKHTSTCLLILQVLKYWHVQKLFISLTKQFIYFFPLIFRLSHFIPLLFRILINLRLCKSYKWWSLNYHYLLIFVVGKRRFTAT